MLADSTSKTAPVGPVGALLRPLAMIGIATGMIGTVADPDLWGHLRFGLDTLASGQVSSAIDPYSFTQDRPFLYHEWLGGVAMAAAYRLAGLFGLAALKALLAAVLTGLLWQGLRRAPFPWRWAGIAVAAWGTLPLVATLRPQLWTAIGVVLVCRLLTSRSPRHLWLLPPIFAIWANLHGGWIVGGGLLALWTGVAWIQRSPLRSMLLLVGGLSLIVTLINPYGFDLWTFLLETVRLSRDDISEWHPIWRTGIRFILRWALAISVIVTSVRRWGMPQPAVVAALVYLAFASAFVTRLVPLFLLAALTLLSRQWIAREPGIDSRARSRVVLDACAVTALVAAALWLRVIPTCITPLRSTAPDTVAAEALRGARGRLVTHFNWGEYVIWHFGPALKVSIDGRRETLYNEATVHEQLAIAAGDPIGLAALARIAPEYIWLPSESGATAEWLWSHGYRRDVSTDRSFIAVRNDLPPLLPWTGESSGCFPGP